MDIHLCGPQVQHFTVPNAVTPAGGQTNNQIATPGGGGITIATLAVQPGQQFTIRVGGNGNGVDGKGGGGGWGFGCGGARGTTGNSAVKNGGGVAAARRSLVAILPIMMRVSGWATTRLLVVAGGGGGGGFGFENPILSSSASTEVSTVVAATARAATRVRLAAPRTGLMAAGRWEWCARQ